MGREESKRDEKRREDVLDLMDPIGPMRLF